MNFSTGQIYFHHVRSSILEKSHAHEQARNTVLENFYFSLLI